MEILQSTAKMQQSQMGTAKVAQTQPMQSVQEIQKTQIHQEKVAQQDTENKTQKVGSQEQMDKLVDQLNRSLDPFSTSLRFGFDNTTDDFYVSVIDTQRNQVLRRFPLEQAEQILPKMQEVTGLLFDHKG
jgi:flagellar protein FlaG